MALGTEMPAKLRHEGIVGGVVFSPDGRLLASGGMDSTLKLWEVEAAVAGEARRVMVRQPSGVTALTFAGDGSWLASGHANRVLRVIDSTSLRLVATLRGPEALVNLLALAPANGLLAVSQDRSIRLFDMDRRSQARVLEGLRRPATAVCCLEERVLAAVSLENLVQMWDLESGAVIATLWGAADESFAGVAACLDGQQLAVTLADGRIRLWGLAD
jgi:WD40 repeat protein